MAASKRGNFVPFALSSRFGLLLLLHKIFCRHAKLEIAIQFLL